MWPDHSYRDSRSVAAASKAFRAASADPMLVTHDIVFVLLTAKDLNR